MHILIIRPGAIGDSLLTFPIIQSLRAKYDDPHITFVGNDAVLPLTLALGLVEEVADYGDLRWSELFSAEGIHTPELREQLQQTELAICWLRDPDGRVEHNLRLAGVKRVIVTPGRPPEGRRIHVVDYLAETVGVQNVGTACNAQCIAPLSVHEKDGRIALHPNDRYIAIHPGSGGAQKCWPAASFAAVIEHLWQRGYPILLLAGPADHERVSGIQRLLLSPPEPGMLEVLIDAPLVVVGEHLQQCKCYLGNDSGITHLAAMLGIPTIALFGPGDPAIWRPLGPHVEVIQERALEQLPVNMVIESILRRL
ncbi:MAG: glycosyltransferase family 9 protein [Chloroflexi bacterium]|nr:MAG: glycosyltransferase family 9 protein [Chloroflexota bacterium]